MKLRYGKKDKLKSKKSIDDLFTSGLYVYVYPFSLVFKEGKTSASPKLKTGVSVSKKNIGSAVDRNRIKRLMRESFRLHKNLFFKGITSDFNIMIFYKDTKKTSMIATNIKMQKLAFKFHKKRLEKSIT